MERCVFENGRKCKALRERNCEKCSFRKTHEELVEGREKARERIENLPKEQHDAIMQKYYRLPRGEEVYDEED